MKNISVQVLSQRGIFFFATATIAFGIQNWIYGDFVMGRAPAWSKESEGSLLWVYASGAVLVIAGVLIMLRWKAWAASLSIAALVLAWSLSRHIYFGHFNWGVEITQTGKALALFGGALVMSTFMAGPATHYDRIVLAIGKYCLASFMIVSGIEHFIFDKFVVMLIPEWIPGKIFWTYFAGIALIAGGAGLLISRTTQLAGMALGIMIFIWFVVLHVPRALNSNGDANEWIAVFEALAMSGVALAISGSHRTNDAVSSQNNSASNPLNNSVL